MLWRCKTQLLERTGAVVGFPQVSTCASVCMLGRHTKLYTLLPKIGATLAHTFRERPGLNRSRCRGTFMPHYNLLRFCPPSRPRLRKWRVDRPFHVSTWDS